MTRKSPRSGWQAKEMSGARGAPYASTGKPDSRPNVHTRRSLEGASFFLAFFGSSRLALGTAFGAGRLARGGGGASSSTGAGGWPKPGNSCARTPVGVASPMTRASAVKIAIKRDMDAPQSGRASIAPGGRRGQRREGRSGAMGKTPKTRVRADQLLVARGLSESRARAQASIAAGLVTADGVKVMKPSQEIACDARLEAAPEHPWVSRGGVKLAAALDRFRLRAQRERPVSTSAPPPAASPRCCLSRARGASTRWTWATGNCMGRSPNARKFFARAHRRAPPRPRARSRSHRPRGGGRELHLAQARCCRRRSRSRHRSAALVALIKPQFEAGRARVKKGIVREAAVHREVCADHRGVCRRPRLGGDWSDGVSDSRRRRQHRVPHGSAPWLRP